MSMVSRAKLLLRRREKLISLPNTTGKNFNIPLAAAYYRLAEEVITAGSANTDVTFIISYL